MGGGGVREVGSEGGGGVSSAEGGGEVGRGAAVWSALYGKMCVVY